MSPPQPVNHLISSSHAELIANLGRLDAIVARETEALDKKFDAISKKLDETIDIIANVQEHVGKVKQANHMPCRIWSLTFLLFQMTDLMSRPPEAFLTALVGGVGGEGINPSPHRLALPTDEPTAPEAMRQTKVCNKCERRKPLRQFLARNNRRSLTRECLQCRLST
ncbi:hypothetical protein KCV07_g859, partial [Aureobasidium melanogenum]